MQQPLNTDDFAFLIGFPPIADYLAFIQSETVDGAAVDRRQLVEQWRGASEIVATLPALDRADHSQPLAEEVTNVRDELVADPIYQYNLLVPSELVTLDLSRIVVLQKKVNLRYSRELQDRLPPDPTPEQVFRFCFMDRDQPPITAARSSQNQFTFTSPSTDFRLLDARMLSTQDNIADLRIGQLAGGLCLAVGYGSNFLSVLALNNLMLLLNGTHRAHALRARGFDRAPFLVNRISSVDELALFYPQNTEQVLQLTQVLRPPMLSDFFNGGLHVEARVPRRRREVRLSFGVDQADLPI